MGDQRDPWGGVPAAGRRLRGIEEFPKRSPFPLRIANSAWTASPALKGPWSRRRAPRRILALGLAAAIALPTGLVGLSSLTAHLKTAASGSTGLAFEVHANAFTDARGVARPALSASGPIEPGATRGLAAALDRYGLTIGDAVVLSSDGGDPEEALAMGAEIRRRGLVTAAGGWDRAGAWSPSACAGACVLAFAGGTARMGSRGGTLGIRKLRAGGDGDPVSSPMDQRVVGYLYAMGVAPTLFDAAPNVDAIRWLSPDEAERLRLITVPAR